MRQKFIWAPAKMKPNPPQIVEKPDSTISLRLKSAHRSGP
jgi:hypothetical protein